MYGRPKKVREHLPYGIIVLPASCYPTQVNAPRSNPSPQAGTRFTYPEGMEGWVDIGYPAMHRPGVEPAIFPSLVRRPNYYTTEHLIDIGTNVYWTQQVRCCHGYQRNHVTQLTY